MITVTSVSKKFNKLVALDNVDAAFQAGQVVALIGPNGSGKTTLIKSILGMVRPQSGDITVNQKNINTDPSYKEVIGYMPQIGRYPDNMKVGQLFRMLKNIRNTNTNIDEELLEKFDINSITEKPMRTLSGGTRQKVSGALAFYFSPQILILDEPTAGLDPLSSEIFKEKIRTEKSNDKLIIITSHILSDLEELCTHVFYMQEGRKVFFETLAKVQEITGEQKLNRAIASMMKNSMKS